MRAFLSMTMLLGLVLTGAAEAGDDDAAAILKAVHLRDRGSDLVWDIALDLIDRNGNVRQRTSRIFRRELDGGRSEQVTVFLSPANIRHTALLDIASEDGEDYMWLYLPALKLTRRIPPTARGDKFVGTDFTMEDVDLGFEHRDYVGAVLQRIQEDGHPVAVLRIEPKTAELKRDLGYDYTITKVRTDQAIFIEQRFFRGGREIRRNAFRDIRTIDGILTPMDLRAEDLVNRHRTVLRVREARYNAGVPDVYFRKEALAREIYR
ncbi:MAG: outer membrane lipoprotein-sorting protein [Pseudomonadota bacterium]|nr:outer membrane lipoprotein-sorting protein [Pseudomonadota bacterium]